MVTWVDPDKVRAKKTKSALQIPEQFFFLVTRTDNDHENSPDDASALLLKFRAEFLVAKSLLYSEKRVFILFFRLCPRKAAINSFDSVFFVVSTRLAVAASVFESIWVMFKIY